MMLVEARVMDSTHLELARPITVTQGSMVIVTVAADSDERDADLRQWLKGSAASLKAAYGDSEPNYTPAMVRETNPEYQA